MNGTAPSPPPMNGTNPPLGSNPGAGTPAGSQEPVGNTPAPIIVNPGVSPGQFGVAAPIAPETIREMAKWAAIIGGAMILLFKFKINRLF